MQKPIQHWLVHAQQFGLYVVQKTDADIQHINGLLKAQKDQTVERVQANVELVM
jgi:hypothetical protein